MDQSHDSPNGRARQRYFPQPEYKLNATAVDASAADLFFARLAVHVQTLPDAAAMLRELAAVSDDDVDLLGKWAAKFGLADESGNVPAWVQRRIVATRRLWREAPAARGKIFIAKDPKPPDPDEKIFPVSPGLGRRIFRFTDPGWFPDRERRKDFEKRVRLAFESYLEEYIRRLAIDAQALAPKYGWTKNRDKDKRKPEQFDWLALRQATGWPYEKIADHVHINYAPDREVPGADRIRKGVEASARSLGLRVRMTATTRQRGTSRK